jgi:uncharacterized repeat protein (TIGR03803 family)
LIIGVLLGPAHAETESVIYNFCSQEFCTDGEFPHAGLTFDKDGNIYGTTTQGGMYVYGTLFKISPQGDETVLYNFCQQDSCADGAQPEAGVIFDQQGNLYGTTLAGGAHGQGVVFKFTPGTGETVLYNFGTKNDSTDGSSPAAGVIFDKKGNLYGTTTAGGKYGMGVVFKLTPTGLESVLYSFCPNSDGGCPDGSTPVGAVVFHNKNLYGTTEYGGKYVRGTVFELTLSGHETVLYNFCQKSGCSDGKLPRAGLVLDAKGNLYGTTWQGGSNTQACNNAGCGVVFRINSKGQEKVLHSFCLHSGCTDGASPYAGVVFKNGSLYGTTGYGGANTQACNNAGCGVVFRITPKSQEMVLYSFCSQQGCADGANPLAGVVFDAESLYGATVAGGNGVNGPHGGVVFRLTP